MNLSKQLKNIGVVTAIGAASILSSTAVNAATISFDQGTNIVADLANPVLNLDLTASDLFFDTNGGGLTITFDNTMFSLTNASIDPVWTFFTSDNSATANVTGVYEVNFGSFGVSLTGTQGLVSLTFDILSAGTDTFAITELAGRPWGYTAPPPPPGTVEPVDSGVYCLDPGSLDCSANTVDTTLFLISSNVTVVPVPAAVWLFGSGLIGLVAVSRRKAV